MDNTGLQIVTANFKEIEELKNKKFILVSVEGLAIAPKGEVSEALRGFSTYRIRYHLQAKDYISCYLLYNQILEKKGFDKILQQMQELSKKYKSKKIALLGSGEVGEFCFRHIVADFFQKNGMSVFDYKNVLDMNIQRQFWHYDPYKEAGHHNLKEKFVGETLEQCKWIFASTMASNPHHYTLRKDFGNDELFLSIAKHIRYFGVFEEFGGMMFRCFYYKDHKYFTHPYDKTDLDVDLINSVNVCSKSI